MAARRWVVTTHVTGTPRAVEVRLYDDLNHMRGASTRHSIKVGEDTHDFSGAVATCQSFIREHIQPDGSSKLDPITSIIRLVVNEVSTLIIAHEVAHAAQHIYGLDYNDGQPVEEHMHGGNEDFAHLYGELFAAVDGIFWPAP